MGLDDGLRLVVQEVERRVLEDDGHALAFSVEDVPFLVALGARAFPRGACENKKPSLEFSSLLMRER